MASGSVAGGGALTASTALTGSAATDSIGALLWAWRHPRPQAVEGRCIGHTDVRVDPRRTRRLARRIARAARVHDLPKQIWTSPLQRCADVGRWLRRWGWLHRIDARLIEMDFGAWEGRLWGTIPRDQIDAWAHDFPGYAASGGESVRALVVRVAAWQPPGVALLVTHAGWMRARRWNQIAGAANGGAQPRAAPLSLSAQTFPPSPAYGALWKIR